MYGEMKDYLAAELVAIEEAGLYKKERTIIAPSKQKLPLKVVKRYLIFAPINYLGLSNNPRMIEGRQTRYGYAWFRHVIRSVYLW